MIYAQSLEGCAMEGGDRAILNTFIESNALETFRTAFQEGELAALSCVEQTEDIEKYKAAVSQFEGFEDILILGIGGSSLGGQTLYALSTQKKPRLHFIDNIDPYTWDVLLAKLDLKKSGVLAISKSGSTVETLMQALLCLQHFEKASLPNLHNHFMVITEPTDNPLKKIAKKHHWACFDHPQDVGGRYSCFSVVGLVPALLAGLDVRSFRKGAQDVLLHHLSDDTPPALMGAAMGVFLENHRQKTLSVLFPYADQLKFFSLWYCQLWAESLGKEGKGTTPLHALGTVDQHSQLQLYLGGPKDKFFTLITLRWKGKGERVTSTLLKGKTMGDLFAAEQRATYETLVNHKCPTRLITVERMDEETLGALMMHFMIETILTSYLIGVNAFNQPAVEQGKRLARKYLAL